MLIPQTLASVSILLTAMTTPVVDTIRRGEDRHRKNTEAAPVCQDFSDEEKLEKMKSLGETELHHTFYQMEELRAALPYESYEVFVDKSRGPVEIQRRPMDSDCYHGLKYRPAVRYPTENGYVTDPCPQAYVLNVDVNRIPETLMEVYCLPCQHCMSEDANSSLDRSQCTEVKYYTRVFRKTKCDGGGKTKYIPVWEPVTVGCACRGAPSRASNGTYRIHPPQNELNITREDKENEILKGEE